MVVCTNLVKNAIKHGSEHDIRIEWAEPALTIINDGLDIDASELEHLFDFAHRGQRSQGYGIGLYVSKLICDHQSWKLELSPNPGGGIRASVFFTAGRTDDKEQG
jgi:signal transduction histidine kinase